MVGDASVENVNADRAMPRLGIIEKFAGTPCVLAVFFEFAEFLVALNFMECDKPRKIGADSRPVQKGNLLCGHDP
jgi:hypothetical protein